MLKNRFLRTTLVISLVALLSACGANKRDIAMKVHSDPQGAYALMQVKHKDSDQADWIFLGPTPIDTNRTMAVGELSSVSFKVMRPGFFEQTKTWSGKEFLQEYKDRKEIVWIPNLVKQ